MQYTRFIKMARSLRVRVASLVVFGSVVACSSADTNELNGGPGGDGAGDPSNGEAAANGDVGDEGDGPLVGTDDTPGATVPGDDAGFTADETAETTADLNLRSGPATTFSILAVIPQGAVVTILNPTPTNGFLNVSWNGINGWCSAKYLSSATAPSTGATPGDAVDVNGPSSPANALARAKLAVGFSYYWGGGAWLEAGVSKSTAGACSGSCPKCTHSGKYGADCSGLVAKAWQFGPAALATNGHPYSTGDFVKDSAGKWSTVSRGALKAGDALVYNSGSAGHIVLWEKGDGWGASTVYECRGCSYGCVYNTRTFGTSFHGIRKAGF
ncbi:hypothetical protein AKJ09_10711 [Labilithrix luteola]|uniref:SH3b domain-containing protein n=1 Tax=Labilithrix luteola TaxID=1391654 RepID=A0A0K1QE93_9BACT|nr:SH3 domain-containing protein [Labilithrix luteola]AKV04048.1 hypothetical protein AKJ09_10711 [Labilithrix luteola]